VGRSKEAGSRFDLYGERLVEVPSGPILKEKEFVHTVTLHDLDVMNSMSGSLISLLLCGPRERGIPPDVRNGVDEMEKEGVDKGKAEVIPGVLFIDDVHMLDIEAFSFLSRAMESELSPILILASNRGFTRIRGTDVVAPHGMPLDLLDRLLIIETRPYSRDEVREILKIRASEEGVELRDDALEMLTDIGVKESLRYAVQLLTPASILARQRGSGVVEVADVKEAARLFVSMKESAEYLKKYEESFLR